MNSSIILYVSAFVCIFSALSFIVSYVNGWEKRSYISITTLASWFAIAAIAWGVQIHENYIGILNP